MAAKKSTAKKSASKAKKERAPKQPKAKKEIAPEELRAYAHDPRVLPHVGKDLTHTERDGTVHICKVLEDGFEVEGVRYNSATAAAKPLQPVDAEGKARAVNGLVYWGVVKTPRPAATPEGALKGAAKALDRAVEKCSAAVEAAGEKKGEVRRTLHGAVKKFEKMLEAVAA